MSAMTSAMRSFDAIIVGGGHNGLVCAGYLARAGMRVVLLERSDRLGGAIGTSELAPGVRVPTLAHTVGRLRASVARDLRLRDYRLRLVQPDARVAAVRADGPALTLWGDAARTAADLGAHSRHDAAAYEAFDAQSRRLSGLLAKVMAMTPPDPSKPAVGDALGAVRLGLGYRGLGSADGGQFLRVLPMAIADHLGDHFGSDALMAALAWRGVRYSSMASRDPGSTQTFLADMAGTGDGIAGEAVFARGGPATLVDALAAAARGFGTDVRTGAEVASILTRGECVTGVALANGDEIAAPVVVSGVDPKRTLLGLIDPAVLGPQAGWQAGNLRLKGSVSKVNFALSDLPAFLGVSTDEARVKLRGRIVVAPTLQTLDRAADAVKSGRIADDLILEATIPSLVDPTLVESGVGARQVMSVLVQGTPYHRREGSWDDARDALGDRVAAALEAVAPGFGALVTARQVITPLDLERDHGLTEGHPMHGEQGLDQWFAWRPALGSARYRLGITGLYLCGSGAHPGGGVTGWPGQNAAREILADRKKRK